MSTDPAQETSPLLSTTEVNYQEKTIKDIANKRESIALNIIDRCINSETNELFKKEEIINAIINNNDIKVDINKPIYDAAGEIINILASTGNLPIVHKEDPDLLSILTDQESNMLQQKQQKQQQQQQEEEIKNDGVDDGSLSSSTHSSNSSRSTKKSRKNKQERIEDMKLRISKHISIHCINQDTNEKYSSQYILNEINDLEFNIRLDRSVEQQGI